MKVTVKIANVVVEVERPRYQDNASDNWQKWAMDTLITATEKAVEVYEKAIKASK